eukprot:c8248_g1_i1.p1 GENE.c8248_g1_i1~~c8248_g1_i1.p1  ORF type:complete len:519 (+),score=112.96 c8248_g1_i1:138-1694(+)
MAESSIQLDQISVPFLHDSTTQGAYFQQQNQPSQPTTTTPIMTTSTTVPTSPINTDPSNLLDIEEEIKLNEKLAFIVSIFNNIFVLLFLGLLLQKLENRIQISWTRVFSPIIIASIIETIVNVFKLSKAEKVLEAHDDKKFLLWPFKSALLDGIGTIFLVIMISQVLDKSITKPLSVILFPFWICVTICSILKLISGSQPTIREMGESKQGLLAGLCYFAYRGVGPFIVCLKIDGLIDANWILIFVPWWVPLFGLSIVSLCFCFSVPCLISCFNPFSRSNLRFPIDENSRIEFQRVWILYMTCNTSSSLLICVSSFSFLLFLVRKLMHGNEVSYTQILFPLFVLFAYHLIVEPILISQRKKWFKIRKFFQALERLLPNTQIDDESRTNIVLTQSTSETLLQLSSNVFQNILVSTFPQIDFESKWRDLSECNSQNINCEQCYVCMTNSQNAVLMNCGHGGICFTCGSRLLNNLNPECPLCRQKVDRVLQLDKMQRTLIDEKSGEKLVVLATKYSFINKP